MKRYAIVIALLGFAAAALAFDPSAHGSRIGILDTSRQYVADDAQMALAIQTSVRDALLSRGLEAFDTRLPYESLTRFDPANADYYVEVVGTTAAARSLGEASVATGHVVTDIGVVMSRVATQIRIYDGRTLELLRTFDLQKRSTAVMPTGIGIGGAAGRIAFWAAVPIVRWVHFRNAAHDVGRDAATAIADEVKH